MSDELPINHVEAKELAEAKQLESNLARCYLDLVLRLQAAELKFELACKTLGGEIERYRNGRDAAQSRLDRAVSQAHLLLQWATGQAERDLIELVRILRGTENAILERAVERLAKNSDG